MGQGAPFMHPVSRPLQATSFPGNETSPSAITARPTPSAEHERPDPASANRRTARPGPAPGLFVRVVPHRHPAPAAEGAIRSRTCCPRA
jgi:hypothetical protein